MVQTKQELQSYEIEVSGKVHPISDPMVSFEQVVNLANPEPIIPGKDERQIYIVNSNAASTLEMGLFYSSDGFIKASNVNFTKFNVVINDIFIRT